MIQYPKSKHMTLPSVEAGFGTLNILRDPPKSIHTRYKPKVGDTQQITEWIDASGDRACEAIKPFARGVNPFVSVQYGNNGTQGGQMKFRAGTSATQTSLKTGQSYLPYRVNREGAFRPPIIPPQELLPLSRLPRLPTCGQTNPGSAQRTIQNTSCNVDLRSVRKELLQVCAAPRASFNIQTDQGKPYELGSMIVEDKLNALAFTNKNGKSYILGVNTEPERGIKTDKNTLYGNIQSKPSSNVTAITPLEQYNNLKMPVRDRVNTACVSNPTKMGGVNKYIHVEKNLDRNRPMASMSINPTRKIDINSTINSRTVNLPERRSRGGFTNAGFKASTFRNEPNHVTATSNQQSVFQKAVAAQQMRVSDNAPFPGY